MEMKGKRNRNEVDGGLPDVVEVCNIEQREQRVCRTLMPGLVLLPCITGGTCEHGFSYERLGS